MPDDFMSNIKQYISQRLLTNPDYESLRVELSDEVSGDYQFSMRKSIGTSLHAYNACIHAYILHVYSCMHVQYLYMCIMCIF